MTDLNDAIYAADLGADYIGIILSSYSKRHVSISVAEKIASAAKEGGAEPVAVFVDETAEQIISVCKQIGIKRVQLHGPISRKSYSELPKDFSIVYTISVKGNSISCSTETLDRPVTLLFDSSPGGSGKPFDWMQFSPPKSCDWILAGGLNPQNVQEAIQLLKPQGVDVASGVEFKNSIRKDPELVKAFIKAAKLTRVA